MNMTTSRSATLALVLGTVFVLGACTVDKTQEGEMPKVDVDAQGGQLPKYDVDPAEVQIETKQAEVTVPDVDVGTQTATVPVPDIDVNTKDENQPEQ